jgi:hypothetical protein
MLVTEAEAALRENYGNNMLLLLRTEDQNMKSVVPAVAGGTSWLICLRPVGCVWW